MSTFESVPHPPRMPAAWLPGWPPNRAARGRGRPSVEPSGTLPPPAAPPQAPVGERPGVTVTVQFTVYGEDAFATAAAVADRLRPIVRASEPIWLDALPVGLEPAIEAPEPAALLTALPGVTPAAVALDTAPLRILSAGYRAELDGTPLALTRREYDLLLFLAEHPGQVFTRVQLLQTVWQQTFVSGQRTIDVHVRRLRAKLGDRGPRIATVRGVGYRLDAPDRVAVIREPG
jgi:Transcriptional regulatory protein, C terminal